jgi:hypothetical protein
MGYLDADRLRVGNRAPRLSLTTRDGAETVTIGQSDAARPTVLIFGSYT